MHQAGRFVGSKVASGHMLALSKWNVENWQVDINVACNKSQREESISIFA